MSNAVVPIAAQLPQMTQEQIKLITETVAKGASPDELKLFLYRCQNLGLDPLKPGQIHFVKYGSGPGTIVVGIEGFRAIAGRTGMLSGVERGVTRDGNGKAVAGWAKVFRKDWTHHAYEEVPMVEYNTGKGPWQKMPETMIKKVAEAAALRMAFPDQVGGIYAPEEMDQAKEKANGPGENDGVAREGYRVPSHIPDVTDAMGRVYQVRTKMIQDCDPEVLRLSIASLEEKYANKPIPVVIAGYIHEAEKQIALIENGQTIDGELAMEPEPEQGTPICCKREMMVSKFPDKFTGAYNWYCLSCKKSKVRQ
jgi:phage recombination protein Bet